MNEQYFKFLVMSVNNAVASAKSAHDAVSNGDVQRDLQNAINCLYMARNWINKAEWKDAAIYTEERGQHE